MGAAQFCAKQLHMQQLLKLALLVLAALLGQGPLLAQDKNAGVIDYEVTMKVDMSKVKIVTIGGDNGAPPPIPDVITHNQLFYFSGNNARLDGAKPRLQIIGGSGNEMQPKIPVLSAQYFIATDKKAFDAIEVTEDGKKYYAEAAAMEASWDLSEKTKKILGYSCRKATVKLKDEVFTVWYTTEISGNFSPIAGLQPPAGFVLSIESDNRSFVAKKIELKAVAATEVNLPADAQKVTKAELDDIRRKAFEDMRNSLQMGN